MQKSALSLTGTMSVLAGEVYEGIASPADGTGGAAKFCNLRGITTDGANLYVPDCAAIRKIVIASGEVTTLALPSFDEMGPAWAVTTDGKSLFATVGRQIVRID